MTFVAKGYSKYWVRKRPAVEEGVAEEGVAEESAMVAPPVPEGGPDVTVVTRVKGPEPGKSQISVSYYFTAVQR